ncbi:hypothetical protein [Glycomyces tritici]|uniref:DUF3784 domain-containing protein n=1 Tax=Glycomyces tritici TaxID=2665176 RepID=A0ABT7YUJ8_9ACTN|nr:hypothetical protein [Glycomyces tritici]MDN3241522.1 hypothetical protein [Glycomyces tritici]MDN3242309.1 hypothetical protein [Glycomyces tritici]
MESSARKPKPRRVDAGLNLAITAATVGWLGVSLALFLWGFDIDFSGDPVSPERQAALDNRERLRIIAFAGGPVLIAVFAVVVERPRTALVYILIALVLLCANVSQERVRHLFVPPSVEVEDPGTDHCVPISGSDRTCPGG